MARVLLIRHCQSTGASYDCPLTEAGHAQATELASWLANHGIDRIVSSPLQRAIDTVAPFAKTAGLEIELDERLRERQLGDVRYPTQDEFFAAVRASIEDRTLRYDGGETGLEVTARAWPALIAALDGANAVTAIAAHGQLITHLLRDIDDAFGFEAWKAMTTPDVFEIQRDTDAISYRRLTWDRSDQTR